MPDPEKPLHELTLEELQRLRAAEELADLRARRNERPSRFVSIGQGLVAYIALAGFFANAYQSCANKTQQDENSARDQARWSMEFKRAQEADKHRAFFETSILATDKDNDDKRLVGYTLLQEFVADPDFNFKATLMLEESLAQELKKNEREVGLDDNVRAQIVAIVTAISQTQECDKLQRAALSIDRLAQRQMKVRDVVETGEVFRVYVRRLLGRAALVCHSMHDFRGVRQPIRDTLIRMPGLGELSGNVTHSEANARIAMILRERCQAEIAMSGASDCRDTFRAYSTLCTTPEAARVNPKDGGVDLGDPKDEEAACKIIADAVAGMSNDDKAP